MVTIDDVAFPLDPTNAEQAGDWDGDDGAYWATYHREYEGLLGVFDATLVEAGAVRADDRVLDVGCGTGATSRALAAHTTEGAVLGLDLSGPMLAIARAAADRAGVRNVEFVQGDAQVYPFDTGSFDVVVSRVFARMGVHVLRRVPRRRSRTSARPCAPAARLALTVWQTDAGGERVGSPPSTMRARRASGSRTTSPSGYTPGPLSRSPTRACVRRCWSVRVSSTSPSTPSTSRWLSGPWTTPGPSSRPGWRRTSTPRRTHARRRRSSGC